MKKITLLFLFCITFSSIIYGQCTTSTGGQWPSGTITLSNSGGAEAIASNNWPNAEFSLIEGVQPGSDYTVAATPSLYITVTNTADDSVIAHGAGSVDFTAAAGVTGLTIYWHLDASCGTQNSGNTATTIQCTTCACTETAAPSAAMNAEPLDGAVDITINTADPDNLLITPFSWTDGTLGGSIESTNLSLGITASGDDIGTITGATNGNGITFDWEENTTYFWYVESIATSPTPADAATAVAIQSPDGGLIFNWTGSGNPDDSYTLNIGTANPPTQPINGVEPGVTITGLDINTTYFWSIDVVNCFGITTGTTVWSFTTDAQLGVEENTLNSFTAYPNPTSGILNIKSTEEIDNVTVFNLLGQSVAKFGKNDITNSSIDLSELSKGLYLVKVTSGNNTETLRVTKK